ncbi:MAG: RIP metalloprotease RseP [Candidatus Marinimicrobia bacterium]|nr:RIP metalloprotease RseP [Candidatus Neomarinimicrobiota bacterium]
MSTIIGIVVVVGGIIFFHELGHYTFAKLSGMRVEQFSIGFPPKIYGKKIGETEYQLSAIPLGGFVKVTGVIDESLDTESTVDRDDHKSFASKPTWQKLLFISGGVLFNLILAVILFFTITMFRGFQEPATEKAVVGTVVEGYPADSVGMEKGDRIVAIDGQKVEKWEDMTALIHNHPNDTIAVSWLNEGRQKTARLKTRAQKTIKDGKFQDIGIIGIGAATQNRPAGFLESIGQGFALTGYWLKITVVSLKEMIMGHVSLKNVGGPVMIAQMAGESARSGVLTLLGFMAVISVNLALLNILPIPALDGGHLIIILVEGIRGRELSNKTKLRIQKIGMLIIFLLMGLVFYNDIARLITGG